MEVIEQRFRTLASELEKEARFGVRDRADKSLENIF